MFEAIYLMSNNKKGVSASELQQQLGLKRNESALYMTLKIRKAMQSINEETVIRDVIELDDSLFTVIDDFDKVVESKRGRETAKQKVLVMVESQAPTDGTHRGKRRKLRMVAVPTLDQVEIWKIEDQLLKRTSSIRTDAYKGYNILDALKKRTECNSQ